MTLYKQALVEFQKLYTQVLGSDSKEPTAVSLATTGEKGQSSVRTVLLKGFDEKGFVFYTNQNSRKGKHLIQNPKASLCFYWPSLKKQVLIEGLVEAVSEKESDDYWATRPRESQLGGWASHQSEKLESRQVLIDRFQEFQKKYDGTTVPRPPHWRGTRLIPNRIEFWTAGDHRLHERQVYEKNDGAWETYLLNP